MQFIRTANDDKNVVTGNHLSFTLGADAEVCVAFFSGGHKPAWLSADGWNYSSETLRITDGCNTWGYDVYCKSFQAGQITLKGPGDCAPMYGVFVETTSCGALLNKKPTASQNSNPGDGMSRLIPHAVNLGSGQDYVRADFGFVPEKPKACIGDLVYYDCDGDGFFEPNAGEYGIRNVRVLLLDYCGRVVDVQYTNSSGRYLFENLEPGCYSIKVSNQNFYCGNPLYYYTQVADRSRLNSDDVNRCQLQKICVKEGDCYLKADFGFRNNCHYYYCNSYWRYNYSTRCWEWYNSCYNCWIISE